MMRAMLPLSKLYGGPAIGRPGGGVKLGGAHRADAYAGARTLALETPIDGIGEPPQFDASPAQHARDRNWHAAKKWQAATSPAIWANTLPSVAGANPAA